MARIRSRHRQRLIYALLAGALASPAAFAQDPEVDDLADLSLEQLGNIDVTSVSKKKERLLDAAASIFVITHDDIRRSGATSLPEALRLAPNVQVAQTGANNYAISARGFNNSDALANKLLVLIDGRTVYSPIHSGVFWEQQDVMLEDVDRIEVISGPGGTLWGANAVNGVINIITKAAGDTQGGLVTLGGGSDDLGGAFRYGVKLGDTGHLRLYGKGTRLNNTEDVAGTALDDGWQMQQTGFRADWGKPDRNFTLQGDAYDGRSDDRPVFGPIEVSGFNVLGRWNERLAGGSDLQVQAYFDRSERKDEEFFQGDANTYDIEFQHGIPLGTHRVLWGAGYREARDTVPVTRIEFGGGIALVTEFRPESRKLAWENIFVQDEFNLSDTVRATLGIKFESNDYTGWETLPSARLAWKPSEDQLIWGAVSRAVRAPARLDRDFFLYAEFPFPPFISEGSLGGPNFESEVADVTELGYRAQLSTYFSYSITAFYSEYDKLRSSGVPPAEILNRIEGRTYGVEAWATLRLTDTWQVSGGLVELRKDLHLEPGAVDPEGIREQGNDPEHQWSLRSTLNITPRHEFDVMVRSVGDLPDPAVPDYTALDMRLGWRPTNNLELSALVRNLFDYGHVEFGNPAIASEVTRSFYLKALLRF